MNSFKRSENETLARFDSAIAHLRALTAGDYRSRSSEICSALSRLAVDGLVLKALVLECALAGKQIKLTGAQSFSLCSNDEFVMRVNCWYPKSRLPAEGDLEHQKYFSIGVCHNHNFDFFTSCVIGPGYKSDFLLTGDDLSNLAEGDTINFSQKWRVRLGFGDAIFVPRETQFHTQELPESFSATINLIPISGQSKTGRQYTLDDDHKTVRRVIIGDVAGT
jgi:hypothetical protein